MNERAMCELCHSQPADRRTRHPEMCLRCARDTDYYDNLTPEEWEAEQESIAAYVAECDEETRRQGFTT